MKIESNNELAKIIDRWPKPGGQKPDYTPRQVEVVSGAVASGVTPDPSGVTPDTTGGGLKLGDKLHKVAGPIGRAIGWPCMKGDGTTDLKPKSLCNYLRLTLNKI